MNLPLDRLRRLPRPAQIVLLAVAHYAAARLGLGFGRLDSIVAPIWPPSGVALAGLLVFGLRAWPAVALSALAVDLDSSLPLPTVAGMALGTTLEAVLAVGLLRRVRFRPGLGRLRDVAALVGLGGGVACAVGAALGAGSLALGGDASGGFWEAWRVWWLGDVLGMLVVGPAALVVMVPPPGGRPSTLAGRALLIGGVLAVAFAGFGPEPVPPYVLFPLITWIATRYSTAGAAGAVLVAGMVGVARTTGGEGPFVRDDAIQSLYHLDAFLAVLAVSALALAAAIRERDRAHDVLRRTNLRLERRIAERTQALHERTEALVRDHERLAEAQRIAGVGSWDWDVRTNASNWSDEMFRIHGLAPVDGARRGRNYLELVHPDDRPLTTGVLARAVADGAPFTHDYRVVRPDGEHRWLRATGHAEVDGDGESAQLVGTCQDITERRQGEERFRDLLDAAPDAMVIVGPDGRLALVNRQTEALLGYTREELVGQPVEVLLPERWHADHEEHRARFFTHPKTRRMGEGSELYARHKHGREVPVEISLSPLQTEQGIMVSAAIRDVTSRKKAEAELAHQALHDSLTGLPNRILLADRLSHALARADRLGAGVSVIFLDLDRFKLINDSLGHAAGDVVLVAVADRLRSVVRAADTVARFGGDEFVVVCDDVEEAPRLAARLAAAMSEPVEVDGDEVFLSVSVGVAVAEAGLQSPEAVLRDADAAMYRAKERGRARIECFDETMRTEALAKLANHTALHRALERGELLVYYQPIVDLRTGRVETVEALVRWQHPERGLVSPTEFIPVAEESGLIVALGAWVLEEAVRQHARWRVDHPDLGLAINLSARQLRHPDLVQSIRTTLAAAGHDASSLALELTESVLMEDLDSYRHTLGALRDLGARLAIDDFGTGYSSLTYLRRFPVQTVKIDQTFVRGLGSDAADLAIVESVIDLAHALGMGVVAEGVETLAQLHLLRELGCDLAQGFYFDPPQPAEQVESLLARRAAVAPPVGSGHV